MADITYAKKRLEPIIKKYNINVESDIVFKSIITMFDKQTDYQMWALKLIYDKVINMTKLIEIKNWVCNNSSEISLLSKKNVISYKSESDIALLEGEMVNIDAYHLVKNFINKFNTAQRKIFKEAVLDDITNPAECLHRRTFNTLKKNVEGFNLLPSHRQQKFISLMSAVTSFESIMQHLKSSLEESYDWNREDLISFAKRNCPDTEICYDNNNVVIIRVPSFESSKKLCGDGITAWCLTRDRSYFNRYTKENDNAQQFFLFDFNKNEKDDLSHVGFTVSPRSGITNSHSTRNNSLTGSGIDIHGERWNIDKILATHKIDKSVYIRLKKLTNYSWDKESFMKQISKIKGVETKLLEDGRIVVSIVNRNVFDLIFGHTYLETYSLESSSAYFAVVDFSKEVQDETSILLLCFKKDRYETLSFSCLFDPYRTQQKNVDALGKYNLSFETFVDTTTINPNILLHKFIDEHNTNAAIKLLEENENVDPNNIFYGSLPAIKAIAQGQSQLFNALLNHPKFDISLTEAFGEPYPHFLLLAMEAKLSDSRTETITPWIEMCLAILDNPKFNINTTNINEDTILHTACESSDFLPIVRYLVDRTDVDVNKVNDWGYRPIDVALDCDTPNIEAISLLLTRNDIEISSTTCEMAKAKKIDLDDLASKNAAKGNGSYANIFAKMSKSK